MTRDSAQPLREAARGMKRMLIRTKGVRRSSHHPRAENILDRSIYSEIHVCFPVLQT